MESTIQVQRHTTTRQNLPQRRHTAMEPPRRKVPNIPPTRPPTRATRTGSRKPRAHPRTPNIARRWPTRPETSGYQGHNRHLGHAGTQRPTHDRYKLPVEARRDTVHFLHGNVELST